MNCSENRDVVYYLNNQKFNGKLKDYDKLVTSKSTFCGDWNDVYIKLDGEIISEISYTTIGCGLNIAVLEIVCEELKGKNFNYISKINNKFILSKLNFLKQKGHCVNLVFDTLSKIE